MVLAVSVTFETSAVVLVVANPHKASVLQQFMRRMLEWLEGLRQAAAGAG